MENSKQIIIALMTDFGMSDQYLACMKGEILKINPNVQLIDISHDIESHNITEAAFILKNTYKSFPAGTIFLCVVDPGVGSERKCIVAKINEQIFIVPDNGLLSYILHVENAVELYKINVENIVDKRISNTFHGRDVFAPLTGEISKSLNYIKSFKVLQLQDIRIFPEPICKISNGKFETEIIHIDKYGNIILSVEKSDVEKVRINSIKLSNHTIPLKQFYAEVETNSLIAYIGSTDNLEIAVNCGNAAKLLNVRIGDIIYLDII